MSEDTPELFGGKGGRPAWGHVLSPVGVPPMAGSPLTLSSLSLALLGEDIKALTLLIPQHM